MMREIHGFLLSRTRDTQRAPQGALLQGHPGYHLQRLSTALQHTATHCNALQHTATHCNKLHHTATHCNTLQHTATHCNTLHHTATHCNTLQRTATHCNTLQQFAPHCNSLQHSCQLILDRHCLDGHFRNILPFLPSWEGTMGGSATFLSIYFFFLFGTGQSEDASSDSLLVVCCPRTVQYLSSDQKTAHNKQTIFSNSRSSIESQIDHPC